MGRVLGDGEVRAETEGGREGGREPHRSLEREHPRLKKRCAEAPGVWPGCMRSTRPVRLEQRQRGERRGRGGQGCSRRAS